MCKFLDKQRPNLCGFRPRPEAIPNCLYCNGVLDGNACWVAKECKAKIRQMENMTAKFAGN